MALNPDDLLIFKAREGEEEEKKEKAKKPAAKPAAAPAQQPIQAQKQKPQAQQKPQPQAAAPAAIAPAQEAKKEGITTYIPQPKEEEIPIVTEAQALEEEYGVSTGGKAAQGKQLTAKESRRIAEHMPCELHPWRRAYAICNYCHRSFCYEDLVEHNGAYYDLDDIDKIPKLRAAEVIKYNTLGFFAGALMLFVFLVFIYSSYALVIRIPFLFQQIGGISGLLANPLQPFTFLSAETLLAVLSLIASISIFMNRKASFRFSSITSVFTVGLFSYLYLNSLEPAFVLIAALSFISMLALAYSRVAIETLPESEGLPASEALEAAKSSF